MSSKAHPDHAAGIPVSDECPSAPPLLVALPDVPAARRERLAALARESGCRLLVPHDADHGQVAISGYPHDLSALRHLLLIHEDLNFVREDLERAVGSIADPEAPVLTEAAQVSDRAEDTLDIPAGTTMDVTKEFTFDAAHNLPRYEGKCERLHGHTFKLHVTLRAPLDPWSGLSYDFADLKRRVKERVIDVLDHRYLNEIIKNPSAEMIALWTWTELSDLPLHEIKVWETPTSFATYHGPAKG